MSESNQNNENVVNQNQNITNNNQVKKNKVVKREKKVKNNEDYYVFIMPEKAKSLRTIVEQRIIEIIREEPLIHEKELILKLIARDPKVKEYYVKTQDISYLQFIIWDMAKQGIIKKAKMLGDKKHVYFFLPEQEEMLKEKFIKVPKK
ncbi:hypothetical protein AAGT10_14970 (plasmid) [Sulfolobus tengchongensis]|uniref:Uncharacterized protein n=1 Tax=Sulfolobus tengchongensis TaxID=207809 RepID=A0AAX4L119_9CREN